MAHGFSNKLVAKQVTAITKPGRHSDGNGLYLLVKANGNRPKPEEPTAVIMPGPKRRTRSQGGVTFWSFADKLIDETEDGFRNDKHRKQWRATLKAHAAKLCQIEIASIVTDDIVATLQPV